MANPYKKAYCDRMLRYFSVMRRNEKDEIVGVPSFLSFANELGVPITVFEKWRREHPEFDKAAEDSSEILRQLLVDAALSGAVNISAAKFILASEFGMVPARQGQAKSGVDTITDADRRLLQNLEERLLREKS